MISKLFYEAHIHAAYKLLLGNCPTINHVIECRSAHNLAVKLGVDCPIISGIYRVIHEGADARAVVHEVGHPPQLHHLICARRPVPDRCNAPHAGGLCCCVRHQLCSHRPLGQARLSSFRTVSLPDHAWSLCPVLRAKYS